MADEAVFTGWMNSRRAIFATVIVAIVAIFLVDVVRDQCLAHRINHINIRNIRLGMTRADVVKILGCPTTSSGMYERGFNSVGIAYDTNGVVCAVIASRDGIGDDDMGLYCISKEGYAWDRKERFEKAFGPPWFKRK